jgi:hypothetical protein
MALHNSSTIVDPRKFMQHLKMNLKTMQGFWFKFNKKKPNDIKDSCLFISITSKKLLNV